MKNKLVAGFILPMTVVMLLTSCSGIDTGAIQGGSDSSEKVDSSHDTTNTINTINTKEEYYIARLEEARDNVDYSSAKELFTRANQDTEVYSLSNITSIYEEVRDLYIEKVVENINNAYSNGNNYEAAENVYQDSMKIFDESDDVSKIEAAIEECLNSYIDYSVDEAKQIYDNTGDYVEAARIIDDAIYYAKESDPERVEELEEVYADYLSHEPMKLTSLECARKEVDFRIGRCSDDISKGLDGTVYNKDDVMWSSEFFENEEESYGVYALTDNYTELSGLIYNPYCTSIFEGEWERKPFVKIYGDDRLLYENDSIGKNTVEPIEFTVDINHVREIKIVLVGAKRDDYTSYPKICLTNLTIKK